MSHMRSERKKEREADWVTDDPGYLVLMYHGIVVSAGTLEAPYCCPPELFAKHIDFLRSHQYTFITLSDIHAHINGQWKMPPKAVALTFDDGFRTVYESAFPILRQYDVPATVFIVSDFIGKTNRWEIDGFPIRSLMTWEQLREMTAHGVEIGGHCCTHPHLTKIGRDRAIAEIVGCKMIIQEKLGKKVHHFSYPFGDMSEAVKTLVEEAGFLTACSIVPGFNYETTDPFILRRIEIRGTDSVRQLRQKLYYGTDDGSWGLPLKKIKEKCVGQFITRR